MNYCVETTEGGVLRVLRFFDAFGQTLTSPYGATHFEFDEGRGRAVVELPPGADHSTFKVLQ